MTKRRIVKSAYDQGASNDNLAGVCIALKCFADDSSADWLGNSVNFLTLMSNLYLLTGPTSKRNRRIK